MHFPKEGRRLRGLGLASLIAGAAFFLMPVQSWAMDSPFKRMRADVQEILDEAIKANASAKTAEERGQAQERMGFAIFNLALIDLEEPPKLHVPVKRASFRPNSGEMQKMLGEAIIEAAWAETSEEKALTQEVLGLVIVTNSLRFPSKSPVEMNEKLGPIVKRP